MNTNHSIFDCRLLETEDSCPMCSEKILSENLDKIQDPSAFLQQQAGED